MRDEKPGARFCWWCGKQLWGNRYAASVIDGHERILHKACAKKLSEIPDKVAPEHCQVSVRRYDPPRFCDICGALMTECGGCAL